MIPVLDMDMAIIPMVTDMSRFGIRIDRGAFRLLDTILTEYANDTLTRIRSCDARVPPEYNPGSPPQTLSLLFHVLRLTNKFGYSSNDKVLARLTQLHPVVSLIQEWRGYNKLITSYARAIPKLADPVTDRIHAQFQITRTDTGRLACKDPNLMAQPTRTEMGRLIRDCFIPDDGCLFLSADYSGIEMRICAHVSQDERMLRVFRLGQDLHSQTASMMFGIPVEAVDEMEHRYPAKRIGFGVLYGLSARGLQREMAVAGLDERVWTEAKCADAITAWFGVYAGVKRFMGEVILFARRYGYVRDMWGRIRLTPGVHSPTPHVRGEAERQAGNMPIQSGAQGVIKCAMAQLTPIYRAYNAAGGVFRPLIQIHDSLEMEVGVDDLRDVAGIMKTVMEGVRTPDGGSFSIPILVDQKAGSRWGSMKKMKGA
jgi:DNA polymerase I